VLVYNLCWTGPAGEAPRLHDRSPEEVQLRRALKAWQAELQAGGQQERRALLLGEDCVWVCMHVIAAFLQLQSLAAIKPRMPLAHTSTLLPEL
jgi:hypothetical protein